ncbi:MAG: helicase [Armatimonadota bacterium]|nr:MAG: helicase [Armatimonadota bacterium]
MREMFVTELVKDVLGPRGGMYETLLQSPVNEYITGVLAPQEEPERDIDATADLPAEGYTEDAEDESADMDILAPPLLSPLLDPQSRPHSIGLFFAVQAEGAPEIEVCITWARYSQSGSGEKWERKPRFSIQRLQFQCEAQELWIDAEGKLCQSNNMLAEVSLYARRRQLGDNTFIIILYLVNRMRAQNQGMEDEGKKRFFTECCVFQPQIRVTCLPGTNIISFITCPSADEEDKRLHFLYREYPVLARGYLCSAVWRKIDPEAKVENLNLDFPDAQKQPPFYWVDGDLLSEQDRQRFSPPDVRTEFVPLYAVQAPLLSWCSEYGPGPETSADKLAELWEPEQMERGLQPLVDGYKRWIGGLRAEAESLPLDEKRIANELIAESERVANRIQEGVNLLLKNDDVRLSFCFAMKAMAVQAQWPEGNGKKTLEWHPFQLAFILMCLESIANPQSAERNVCDLLWVPTGAGKTEAYLALAAFTMAYRRRRALKRESGDRTGAGVAVISRYTLRLLTIQQFRRTLKMVTACEYLRVYGLGKCGTVGWRPRTCNMTDNFIWGSSRFGAGLWVGGGVTPNRLRKTWGGKGYIYGAIDILNGNRGAGEPAQVLNCPACNTLLAFSDLSAGSHILYYVVSNLSSIPPSLPQPQQGAFQVTLLKVDPLSPGFNTLQVELSCKQKVTGDEVDEWWQQAVEKVLNQLKGRRAFARASRPGYFMRRYIGKQDTPVVYDFDIYCPNPNCPLHIPWLEGAPMGDYQAYHSEKLPLCKLPDGNLSIYAQEPFRLKGQPYYSDRVPIPAYTVDEQVYHRCPSIVIATVDKFARLAFEPRASALFGNVNHYHCIWGYYRPYAHPSQQDSQEHPSPTGSKNARNYISIPSLEPPDLILQDELHLIEGPLGGLVGIYETAVDFLCSEAENHSPKYIASTATVRRAQEQVKSVFNRSLQTFPPPGLTVKDSFFIRFAQEHPLQDRKPGRLYVGVCAPGRGPLTPVVRIWARLLHTANKCASAQIDPFWTLTGYFNAIRELGGARALYRQDIPQRLQDIATMEGVSVRQIDDAKVQELSSRTPSVHLPAVLETLNRQYPDASEALFTTSMFGTGVDIPRISLMVVHGQPKTTSAYIQSTGRVGRRTGALVVAFLRATRPRDLSHYEFFCGYHAQLHRFVEPISVSPFAPGVVLRAAGPIAVAVLRNQRFTSVKWYREDDAMEMSKERQSKEVQSLPVLLERRARAQPPYRQPSEGYVENQAGALLDKWHQVARQQKISLRYVEYAISSAPKHHVVLGDPQHQHHKDLQVVYENAPQSLRDIEETCGFET